MYYVNKIVGWVLSPLGLLFMGLVMAELCGCLARRRASAFCRRLKCALVALTLLSVWVLGCGVTTRWIGLPLEGEESPLVDTLQVGGIDAVVVLGGGVGIHEKCGRVELYAGADRVWTASRLWKAFRQEDGGLPLVLGGGMDERVVPLFKDFGVEEKSLRFVDRARNTEEEAQAIFERIRPEDGHMPRIMLVTSAWHMPRAQELFRRAGFDVLPKPTDYEMHCAAERDLEFSDFFPNAESLMRNSYAVKEWVARLGYAVFRK